MMRYRRIQNLLLLSVLLFSVFFYACNDSDDNDDNELGLGNSNYAAGLFHYDIEDSRYVTQHIYRNMGAALAVGNWDSNHCWDKIVPVKMGEDQYIVGHGTDCHEYWNNHFFIQRIFDTGDLGPTTYSDDWDNYYNNFLTYSSGGRYYVFGESDEDNHRYFTQEILPGGKLAAHESDSGNWTRPYANLVVMQTGDGAFLFGQSKDDNFWFISLLGSGGAVHPARDEGNWNHYYPTIVQFRVGGKQYIFGHRKTTLGKGPWFIQHITRDGHMGAETDSGEWDHYFQTVTSFVGEDGETYLWGQNTDKHWFIQRINSDGTMGPETDSGDWNNYYDVAFSFDLDKSYWDTANWMGNQNDLIGSRKLSQIAMPGSHDAGMNEDDIHDCHLGRTCNTATQTSNFKGQLEKGSRFFDVRPILYTYSQGNEVWSTGHFQVVDALGAVGCEGEDRLSMCDALNDFFADGKHKKELVILKISHWLVRDGDTHEATDNQQYMLATGLVDDLDDYVVKCDDCNLTDMTIDEILALGNIVLVFSSVDRDRANGIFKWGYGKGGDYYLNDNYSDTEDYSTMLNDQISMLLNSDYHSHDKLFLLSWTLTLDTDDAMYCNNTILDLASRANPRLYEEMWDLIDKGKMTKSYFPNILYVDAFDTFATRTAINLNTEYENLGD